MLRDDYLEKNGKVYHQFDSEQPNPQGNMTSLEREKGFFEFRRTCGKRHFQGLLR